MRKEKSDKVIDQRDIVGIIGVILIGVGCWWISPPIGLIAPGTILAWVAITGGKR